MLLGWKIVQKGEFALSNDRKFPVNHNNKNSEQQAPNNGHHAPHPFRQLAQVPLIRYSASCMMNPAGKVAGGMSWSAKQ